MVRQAIDASRAGRQQRELQLEHSPPEQEEHPLRRRREGAERDVLVGRGGAEDCAHDLLQARPLRPGDAAHDLAQGGRGVEQLVGDDAAERRGARGAEVALEHHAREGAQLVLRRERPHLRGIDGGILPRQAREVSEGRLVEPFLAAEVVVDRGEVGARGIHDVPHARGLVAVQRELVGGGIDEPLRRCGLVRVEHAGPSERGQEGGPFEKPV